MDIGQAMESINYFAVLTAALSAFIIGGLWYSVLFAKPWMKENGLSEEDLRNGKLGIIFGGSFLFSLIIAFVLVMFLGPERNAVIGASAGLMAGLFWVAASFGITYLFERKSLRLFLINAGYHVVTYTVMGLILGAWK
ncbi:DUF1761 domain-containing protein [Thalassobacillus hwangdonensis]|uniref:DUF1761 domain-containing protein n=1 Tax=Thalassobacillus hwangdonensis TaxID=546108 RepID=A0ABW3L2Y2_9BACI